MTANQDYEGLCAAFNVRGARYLIVGAHAVGFHARPRFTNDLDLWLEPTKENGQKAFQALRDFGFRSLRIAAEDLSKPDAVFQLGISPVRVDLLTSLPGLTFEEAYQESVPGKYGGVPVRIIGLDHLMALKRAAGRPQDLIDLDVLEKMRKMREGKGKKRGK